jgi:hypothetical protein
MDPRDTTPPSGADRPPPAGRGWGHGDGWDWRGDFYDQQPQWRPPLPDVSSVLALIDALRRMIPPELQEQFAALQRELLLTVRALIDWYLERLDQRARPVSVEDIPID